MVTAKRMLTTYADVIKALAKRCSIQTRLWFYDAILATEPRVYRTPVSLINGRRSFSSVARLLTRLYRRPAPQP